jgi:CBS domain-containing protein
MADLESYTIASAATLLDAVEKILGNKSRCVCVLEEERVIGVFSEGDVMRALLKDTNPYAVLSAIVKPSFMYLQSENYPRALEIIRQHLITLIPVVDADFRLKKVITIGDVLSRMELKQEDAPRP